MLEEAKRVVPGIAREIRDERKRRGLITAPPDSPHIRMSKGIAKANEIAPPKWYQAPKVTEIIDPGGYGRRRYRVITGLGEYCLTYEGVYSPSAKQSTQPVITSCDKNEQAATKQEW